MNILKEIVRVRRIKIEKYKKENDIEKIKSIALQNASSNFPFEKALKKSDVSFICEIKKASPSKGIIVEDFPYLDIAKDYEKAGADAISVLTEPDFFKGNSEYLREIKNEVKIPVIRKDFIIDEIMIYESKIINADAILLICAILTDEQIKEYIKIADGLGISCLVETHDENEIKRAINQGARIIGVNNRNLKTFEVDIKNSIRLRHFVPENIIFVSESGIKSNKDIEELRKNGTDAVLIGETFMRADNKTLKLAQLKGL